ncbi:MAG: heavy-metal-associated domain-containing protein [Azonexus sp.]
MNTQSVNSISRQIFVLHKSEGHVRFALPVALANPGSAAVIEAALLRIPGVRLAKIDVGTGKIGIHYDPVASSLRQLALVLNASLEAAAAAAPPAASGKPAASGSGAIGQQLARGLRQAESLARGFLQRVQAQLAPPQAAAANTASGKLAPLQRAFNPSLLTEKSVINFANDIVAFYLIRVHWNLITQHWIKAPLQHGSAWLTVFYLTFLLVRYRKGAAPAPAKALPAPVAEKAAA